MKLEENYPLKNHNFFSLDAKCKYFAEVSKANDIKKLIDSKLLYSCKKFFLGGGSNILFVDDFDGIVIHFTGKRIQILSENEKSVLIEVESGLNWDDFVRFTLEHNFFGLENLTLIPGKIGGAIVQNIGAYGAEVKEFVKSVKGYELGTGKYLELPTEACNFTYRNSIFKQELKDKFIITSVVFELSKKPTVNLSYIDLQKEAQKIPNFRPHPHWVFNTVRRIRQEKLPDFNLYPNCGSFFKNPIVNEDKIDTLKPKFSDLVHFRTGENLFKIPAAWLIEKAGWKGKRIGNVGTYERHSLVIINYGVSKGKEILDFAQQIKQDVKGKFGIDLEFEVEIIYP